MWTSWAWRAKQISISLNPPTCWNHSPVKRESDMFWHSSGRVWQPFTEDWQCYEERGSSLKNLFNTFPSHTPQRDNGMFIHCSVFLWQEHLKPVVKEVRRKTEFITLSVTSFPQFTWIEFKIFSQNVIIFVYYLCNTFLDNIYKDRQVKWWEIRGVACNKELARPKLNWEQCWWHLWPCGMYPNHWAIESPWAYTFAW